LACIVSENLATDGHRKKGGEQEVFPDQLVWIFSHDDPEKYPD
jgi:hypothetical protein